LKDLPVWDENIEKSLILIIWVAIIWYFTSSLINKKLLFNVVHHV